MMVFCVKCVRLLCPTCLSQQPGCPAAARELHPHEFAELEKVPALLRSHLDSIQTQLSREQNSLLERVQCFASEQACKEEEFHTDVSRVVRCMEEALHTLQQLQTAIRAAAASAIASVLRAGVESNTSQQRVEDVHARALASRQMSGSVSELRNLDDASLLMRMPFVRNLVRCTEPVAATSPPPPSPSEPALASHALHAKQESAIELQLKNIINQGKEFIQALASIPQVCTLLLQSFLY